MRTLLRFFAGFHRQPLSGLLQGLLYLEVGKSRSASSIELEISRRYSFCYQLCSFFCDLRFRFPQFNMCDFVASTQAFIAKAKIACEQWCLYI